MKKSIYTTLLLALLPLVCLGAGPRTIERTYVVTDRPYYAAGETIYCSLFCIDGSTSPHALSPFSGVAYIELYSTEGTGATAKAALYEGRGSASIEIPRTLPTGNYRIAAYTAVQKNEEGISLGHGARTVSIFNTTSSARIPEGVAIVEDYVPNQAPLPVDTGEISFSQRGGALSNSSTKDATLSVSLYHENGLQRYDSQTLSAFLSSFQKATAFSDKAIPEYDGEIINVSITDRSGNPISTETWDEVFLSSPGSTADLYSSAIRNGKASFFTNNIYGSKEVVFSLSAALGNDTGATVDGLTVEVESPFVGLKAEGVPVLNLGRGMEATLSDLSVSAQVGEAFSADSTISLLSKRVLPFTGEAPISYVLDDYTRFPTMREVIIEFVSEVRARRTREGVNIQVKSQDNFRGASNFSEGASLVLLDGVPVFNHGIVYEMDPLLVKRIDVFPYSFTIGMSIFNGVVNFVTYKGDMAGASLGAQSRMLSFKGVSVPQAIRGEGVVKGRNPILGKTLYWDPTVSIKKGGTATVDLLDPDYEGDLRVVVEGLSSDGSPIFASYLIRR